MEQISTKYTEAVQLIKSAILQNQLEAAKAVNRQMLALYYGVGKYVSENTLYEQWSDVINRPPMAGDLDWHDFFALSFSHHDEILSKTTTIKERAFYIHQAAREPHHRHCALPRCRQDIRGVYVARLQPTHGCGYLPDYARATEKGIASRRGNQETA